MSEGPNVRAQVPVRGFPCIACNRWNSLGDPSISSHCSSSGSRSSSRATDSVLDRSYTPVCERQLFSVSLLLHTTTVYNLLRSKEIL